MNREFMESSDGVHLMHGEYTLCGDAFDLGETEEGEPKIRTTAKRIVTCPNCIEIIELCKGVRRQTR